MNFNILFFLPIYIFFQGSSFAQSHRGIIKQETACIEWQTPSNADLAAISAMWGISNVDILKFNPHLGDQNFAGNQNILLPVTSLLKTANCEGCKPVYHMVGKSEGLYRVSVWYGGLKVPVIKANNGLKNDALFPGQQLLMGYLPAPVMPVLRQEAVAANRETTGTQEAHKNGNGTAAPGNAAPQPDTAPDSGVVQLQDEAPALTYEGLGMFASEWHMPAQVKQKFGKAASFKTASGWADGKYYVLNSQVRAGTVVKIEHPNGRSLYAKVVGPLPDIKQNQGLLLRLSNAAAAALNIWDDSVFEVTIKY